MAVQSPLADFVAGFNGVRGSLTLSPYNGLDRLTEQIVTYDLVMPIHSSLSESSRDFSISLVREMGYTPTPLTGQIWPRSSSRFFRS